MLSPKKTKYPKAFKSNIYGISDSSIISGNYAIQALTPGRLTANQIEAARKVLSRYIKRQGKL